MGWFALWRFKSGSILVKIFQMHNGRALENKTNELCTEKGFPQFNWERKRRWKFTFHNKTFFDTTLMSECQMKHVNEISKGLQELVY